MSTSATGFGSFVAPPPVAELERILREYLPDDQVCEVRRSLDVAAHAHSGQTRKSGEPYIYHPVAVARILAEMRLDHETICAAALHDAIEDTDVTKDDVVQQFGAEVAELVDGVTKLEKVEFSSRREATAESFRKMMLAMARDLRVILIKLADRLHNMRTLGAMAGESRRRIARETLEIYAPIAQRLGMNALKAELQDLGFAALYPLRYRVIEERVRRSRGTRREVVVNVRHTIEQRLAEEGILVRVEGRIKTPYSIFRKMSDKDKSFDEILDVYGFRVVVPSVTDCYRTLGIVHNLYKPVSERFKDYIAIPKANGYQSLHTTLFGPYGDYIEIQIRTTDMDRVAERGIAAHWVYQTDTEPPTSANVQAREWILSLLEMQKQAGNSEEFLEHVRVDLFPDEVYVFTPTGEIVQLTRDSTVVDFAYAIHTDIGNHCVGARIDKEPVPLLTRLESGQTVEVITDRKATPHPDWLAFVATSKARAAIRHYLKNLREDEAVRIGHEMLELALARRRVTLDDVEEEVLTEYLEEHGFEGLDDLLADIALGNRVPTMVAKRLTRSEEERRMGIRRAPRMLISGTEGEVMTFPNCCHPVPGDRVFGYLSAGKGVVVHRRDCKNAPELKKHAERLIKMDWGPQIKGEFKVLLRLEVKNRPGVLATVAAEIADAGSNIEHVEYQERDSENATLELLLTVDNRRHLARIIRRVRRTKVVLRAFRVTA